MVLGLSILHVFVLIVLLVGIALPFILVAHARHARAQIAVIMLLTLVCFVLFLWFGHNTPNRSDLVLLRSYAFSSALCSFADELLSARDEKTPTRFILQLSLGIVFVFTLVCLVGGISGAF